MIPERQERGLRHLPAVLSAWLAADGKDAERHKSRLPPMPQRKPPYPTSARTDGDGGARLARTVFRLQARADHRRAFALCRPTTRRAQPLHSRPVVCAVRLSSLSSCPYPFSLRYCLILDAKSFLALRYWDADVLSPIPNLAAISLWLFCPNTYMLSTSR